MSKGNFFFFFMVQKMKMKIFCPSLFMMRFVSNHNRIHNYFLFIIQKSPFHTTTKHPHKYFHVEFSFFWFSYCQLFFIVSFVCNFEGNNFFFLGIKNLLLESQAFLLDFSKWKVLVYHQREKQTWLAMWNAGSPIFQT